MVLSVVIHVALLATADWLLRKNTVPAITSTSLLVRIEPLQSAGDLADSEHVVPEAASEAESPSETRQPSRRLDKPAETIQAIEMVVVAEISPRYLSPAAEATRLDNQTTVDPEDSAVENDGASLVSDALAAPTDVVTTISPDEEVVIVGVSKAEHTDLAQVAWSPTQANMLNRKVREWSEKLYSMQDVAAGLTWKDRGQQYQAKFTLLPVADDMGIQRVIVEISTEEDGKRLSSKVHMKRLAFSHYAQFVNRWDARVQIHNDELEGRFHSNSGISLAYDRKVRPLFHGKVTTTSRRISVVNSRGSMKRDQIFLGGLQTGVRSIRLPKQFLPFPGETEIADDQVHHFIEDTRITFRADGSYVWQPVDSESPPQMANVTGNTMYLIADRKVNIHVKGTVNGKVLVYSPERIVIEDDLVYEQNPEEVPDSDDYLGLVSDKYVDIAPPNITGPGDLLINAAIYAQRRFAVRGYRYGENALLYLYGSLSVGSLSATEPRYYTKIRFDQRLERLRPPGFPMTDRYEVESWDMTWNVEPIEQPNGT